MKKARLEQMTKGWFVGNFEPTVLRTAEVEVAVKHYKSGDFEAEHHHKVAAEVTVIVTGRVKMNGVEHRAGDILLISPGESSDFEVLEDTVTTVVKYPGVAGDKYPGPFRGEQDD